MPAGVYLHIPFCKSRCSYCDFATDVYKNSEAVGRYVSALCKEINEYRIPHVRKGDTTIDTIYFGGGTPSLLSPNQVERVLQSVNNKFTVSPDTEITMEMNPATVTPETLRSYRLLGINRASFGVQTFDDNELRRLARGHTAQDARDTFRMLRDEGFENISFDLIAGLLRQTLADWERNLDEALSMHPEHLSLYLLEIHEGTPLAEQVRSQRQPAPDDDIAAQMYEMMLDMTSSAGYEQYEISNFSLPGMRSRHNSKYWRLEPVFGFGVSAHSFDGLDRYANVRDTDNYVRRMESDGSAECTRERINPSSEFAFLNLRLTDGLDIKAYRQRFGTDITETHANDIDRLLEAELLNIAHGKILLTRRGMLFSNEVFSAFV